MSDKPGTDENTVSQEKAIEMLLGGMKTLLTQFVTTVYRDDKRRPPVDVKDNKRGTR